MASPDVCWTADEVLTDISNLSLAQAIITMCFKTTFIVVKKAHQWHSAGSTSPWSQIWKESLLANIWTWNSIEPPPCGLPTIGVGGNRP